MFMNIMAQDRLNALAGLSTTRHTECSSNVAKSKTFITLTLDFNQWQGTLSTQHLTSIEKTYITHTVMFFWVTPLKCN